MDCTRFKLKDLGQSMPAASTTIPPLYHLPGFYEPFSAISHLLGAVVFLVLGWLLLREGRGNRARMICLGVYSASAVFMFSMSGLYHMQVRGSAAQHVFRQLDYAAIYVMTAGTFTAGFWILYRGWLRWAGLLYIWTAAIAGLVLTTVFSDHLADGTRLSCYLALGWSGLFATIDIGRRYGFRFIRPLLLGGAINSAAAVAQYFGWPMLIPRVVHAHELFHVAILAGSVLHWLFILQFATGKVLVAGEPRLVDRSAHGGVRQKTQPAYAEWRSAL